MRGVVVGLLVQRPSWGLVFNCGSAMHASERSKAGEFTGLFTGLFTCLFG